MKRRDYLGTTAFADFNLGEVPSITIVNRKTNGGIPLFPTRVPTPPTPKQEAPVPDSSPIKPDKSRETKRGDYRTWLGMAKSLGLSQPDFAEACGYSRSGFHDWERNGCPSVALLAGEALLRRQNKDFREQAAFVKIEIIGGVPKVSPLAVEEVTILGTTYRVIKE